MKPRSIAKLSWTVISSLSVLILGGLAARSYFTPTLPYTPPTYQLSGAVDVPAFQLPPSEYMSEEARGQLKLRMMMPAGGLKISDDIQEARKTLDGYLSSWVKATKEKYAVDMAETQIEGIPVRVFTPRAQPADPARVLINVHGGAFSVCWDSCSVLESIPLSAIGNFKVVSVNYRMGPEAKHPAALEDLTTVYRALLKDHSPQNIGIYGCSAGGMLSAQAASSFPDQQLPQPGAIGIFGAGAVPMFKGESAIVTAYTDGTFPPPSKEGDATYMKSMTRGYFDGVDLTGPIISPGLFPERLARFPPTMIVTGTRAMDLSPAIVTNSALIKAGVQTQLIVGEAMGHCYLYNPAIPESRDAVEAAATFFKQHLR